MGNPKLTLAPFDSDDMLKFRIDETLLNQCVEFCNPAEFVRMYDESPSTDIVSIVDENDKVYGVLISSWCHERVAHIWIITGKEIKQELRFKKQFLKLCKAKFNERCERWNLHRVQAYVAADYPQGIRFAKHLGLKIEGVMNKFSPLGNDYLLMAWVKPEPEEV